MSEQNGDEQRTQSFNPRDHLMQIGSGNRAKDYLPVQWRLVWFREQCPEGTIKTKMVLLDLDRETEEEATVWNNETRRSEKVIKRANGFAVFYAVAKDGKGGIGTGTKSEKAASFPDYIEKAETGAIGRALAALGYGTQFTGDEFDERHRIVDAPVPDNGQRGNGTPERRQANAQNIPAASVKKSVHTTAASEGAPATDKKESEALATEQQLASIRKLCQYLGKPEPEHQETMTYLNAKEVIAQLSLEYRQAKQPEQSSVSAQEEEPAEEKYDKSLSKNGMSTEQQRESISKFCRRLGRNDPPNLANMTFEQAKDYISGLNAEMRTKKAS